MSSQKRADFKTYKLQNLEPLGNECIVMQYIGWYIYSGTILPRLESSPWIVRPPSKR